MKQIKVRIASANKYTTARSPTESTGSCSTNGVASLLIISIALPMTAMQNYNRKQGKKQLDFRQITLIIDSAARFRYFPVLQKWPLIVIYSPTDSIVGDRVLATVILGLELQNRIYHFVKLTLHSRTDPAKEC